MPMHSVGNREAGYMRIHPGKKWEIIKHEQRCREAIAGNWIHFLGNLSIFEELTDEEYLIKAHEMLCKRWFIIMSELKKLLSARSETKAKWKRAYKKHIARLWK